MKVVILAGGFGTRLSEYTDLIPKPMVTIGGIPVIEHIMNIYSSFGFNEFIIALGYKGSVIKEYFYSQFKLSGSFTINMADDTILKHNYATRDWKISLIDTGLSTMTGGRLKRLKDHLSGETFMMTYGDGLSDVNLDYLKQFHFQHGKKATVLAVRPSARFGELIIDQSGSVSEFSEKPRATQGRINGGFFVLDSSVIDLIKDDTTFFEKEPLEILADSGELMAFKHDSFWQCMDTKRDKDYLENLFNTNSAPWINAKNVP